MPLEEEVIVLRVKTVVPRGQRLATPSDLELSLGGGGTDWHEFLAGHKVTLDCTGMTAMPPAPDDPT